MVSHNASALCYGGDTKATVDTDRTFRSGVGGPPSSQTVESPTPTGVRAGSFTDADELRERGTLKGDLMPKSRTSASSLRGRIGAEVLHSRTDGRDITEKARAAFEKRFLDEVDPERRLPEAERNRRAQHARNAYFSRLALASAKARSLRKADR